MSPLPPPRFATPMWPLPLPSLCPETPGHPFFSRPLSAPAPPPARPRRLLTLALLAGARVGGVAPTACLGRARAAAAARTASSIRHRAASEAKRSCLLYTSDAADDIPCVDL
eukprot:2992580-Pyramimonas_sp.AAC.1